MGEEDFAYKGLGVDYGFTVYESVAPIVYNSKIISRIGKKKYRKIIGRTFERNGLKPGVDIRNIPANLKVTIIGRKTTIYVSDQWYSISRHQLMKYYKEV